MFQLEGEVIYFSLCLHIVSSSISFGVDYFSFQIHNNWERVTRIPITVVCENGPGAETFLSGNVISYRIFQLCVVIETLKDRKFG